MKKTDLIRNLADLAAIKEKTQPLLQPTGGAVRVVVGLATCGVAAGAQPVYESFKKQIAAEGLENVTVIPTGCVGICQFEPVVEIYANGVRTTYVRMSPEKVARVVRQHLRGGNPVAEYTIGAKQ